MSREKVASVPFGYGVLWTSVTYPGSCLGGIRYCNHVSCGIKFTENLMMKEGNAALYVTHLIDAKEDDENLPTCTNAIATS